MAFLTSLIGFVPASDISHGKVQNPYKAGATSSEVTLRPPGHSALLHQRWILAYKTQLTATVPGSSIKKQRLSHDDNMSAPEQFTGFMVHDEKEWSTFKKGKVSLPEQQN